MQPRRRKLLLIGVGAVAALAAFEIALQIGAWWLWRTSGREHGSDGAARILCVGDSFTWGLGADGPQGSYPMQLEVRLRQAGRDIAVVNGGLPGQSSRDVALKLARQLRAHRPFLVYVLIGTNDPWKRPAPVTLEQCRIAGDESFPWLWRSGRLLAMAGAWLRDDGDDGGAGFVGTWHTGDRELTFEAGGRFLADGTELRWLRGSAGLRVLLPSQVGVDIAWRRDGERLLLTSSLWREPLSLEPGPLPQPGPLARARVLLREARFAEAIPLLEQCVGDAASEIEASEALVLARVRTAGAGAGDAELTRLRQRYREDHGVAAGEALAHALLVVGSIDEAVAVAAEVFERTPSSVRAAQVLMGPALASHRAAAEQAFERAISALPAGNERRNELHMTLAILRKDRPQSSLRAILQALHEGSDENFARQFLFAGRSDYTASRFEAVLTDLALAEAESQRLRAVYESAMQGPQQAQDVLAEHLRSIVALSQEYGATVVLLTYPNEYPGHDDVVQRVAAEQGVDWIAVRPDFEAALRTQPREALFIPDGHCTTAGYAILADVVARDALGRLP